MLNLNFANYKQNETAVKSVGERKIKGMGIRFGSPEDADYDKEWFAPESQLGLTNGSTRPILIEHGWETGFGKNVVATATYEKTTDGWEYIAVFDDSVLGNKAYNEIIVKNYKSSAGAAGHTVERTEIKSTHRLDTWLIAEQSFTQFPADSQNPAVTPVKSSDIYQLLQLIENDREETVKAILDKLSSSNKTLIEATNLKLENLRTVMLQLKDSFMIESESDIITFRVTDSFLAEIEELTQPISLLN